jgi:hypothetical protein
MKIVLLVVGPLFIVVGLFWFGQGTGLFSGPHNAALVDAGAGFVALGIGLVRIAVASPPDFVFRERIRICALGHAARHEAAD